MSSLEKKRDDFRKYLESAGAIENLTKALIKLYEQQNKPTDAVKFIRKYLCESCPDDEQFDLLNATLDQANKKICKLERDLIRIKGSIRRTASETDLVLTKGLDDLSADSENQTMLKEFLTKDVMESLKVLRTSFKGTLLDCVQGGLEVLNSPIGAFACDAEAYTVFAPLFNPMIEALHGFKSDGKHPDSDWGEACKLPNLEDTVLSVRIECTRAIDCYPYASLMSMDQYEEIMSKVQSVTKCLSGDLKGKFYPLEGIDDEVKKTLFCEGVMFLENDHFLTAAKASRFWPTGRGVFTNETRTFAVWCNKEDHLRFVSLEQSGNLRNAYDRLVTGVTKVCKDIAITPHEKLGFLTFSPENLGNTLSVSIRMKLEKIVNVQEQIDEILEKFSLKIVEVPGDECNIYEISSKKKLGLTEFETISGFAEGIETLFEAENAL